MPHWTYAHLEQVLDEYIGVGDPSDTKARKKLHILNAATELFITQGYRKTSVDEIAERSGVAKGTVYLYFNTKAELLYAAVALEEKSYLVQLRPILEGDLTPQQRLKLWLSKSLVLGTQMPLTSKLVQRDRELLAAMSELPPDLLQRSDSQGVEFFGGLIDEAAQPHRWTQAELTDRAHVLWALAFFAHFLPDERIRGGLPIERFADLFADMLVDGLAPPPAAGPQKENRNETS